MISFAEKFPEFVSEWGKENGQLTPQTVSYGSNKKIHWIGKCGHKWVSSPKARSHGEGCPYCAGKKVWIGFNDLSSQYPELSKEWSDKNEFLPTEVTTGSSKKVWWKCRKCGHEWQAVVKNRTGGSQCPRCAQRVLVKGVNDFATLHPDLVPDWSPKNAPERPDMFQEFSNHKVWWKCQKCGYEWKSAIANRSSGSGCVCCAGRKLVPGVNDLVTTHPEIAAEWSEQNGELHPEMFKANAREVVWWTCLECQKQWRASINSRCRGRSCPHCAQTLRIENSIMKYRYRRDMIKFENSIREAVIRFYTKKYRIETEFDSDRLVGVKIDIYFPQAKGAIILSSDFHENLHGRRIEYAKNELLKKSGIRLIRILEPGFQEFDDCTCISCKDDTLEAFDQALEIALESFGFVTDIDTERDLREIFVNYQQYLENGA